MTSKTLSKRQEKTRLALMKAFLTLIVRDGFDQISVTEIAEAADYGRWTFYQYFDSKEDMAWQCFVYWMLQLDRYLVEAVQGLESPAREYESWRLIFYAFQAQNDFFSKLGSIWFSLWHKKAKEFLIEQFLQHLNTGTFKLMEGVRPHIAARLYVVAIAELLETWGYDPTLGDAETLVDEFFIFIFNQKPPKPSKN